MKKFAKLFEFDDIGQVLAVLDESDTTNEPELTLSFTPSGNLGLCATKLIFAPNDAGWEAAEKALDILDEKKAREIVDPIIKKFGGMFSVEEEE